MNSRRIGHFVWQGHCHPRLAFFNFRGSTYIVAESEEVVTVRLEY